MAEIVTRYECQACEARWYGTVTPGALADHESRWHDGAQTVVSVLVAVIEEVRS